MINKQLIDFALSHLWIYKKKNLFFFFILSCLVFLVGSVFFISSSLQHQSSYVIKSLPDIVVQKELGSRQRDVEISLLYNILEIPGVSSVKPRVWGRYYFPKANLYFSVIGLDKFDYDYSDFLQQQQSKIKKGSMIIGKGVYEILKRYYYQENFRFITPSQTIKDLHIIGTFPDETNLLSYDTIVMDITDAQEILGVAKGYVTDLAVYIPNKEEIDTIATKIQSLAPNVKIITHQQLISKYETLYHYKGGIFLVVFLIALLTFFIVVSDKLSGISSSEQHEIATLKALGWSMQDIIKEKFLESFILSFGAYLFGIIIALWYVYIIHAPLLDQIFEGESGLRPPFALLFHFDVTTFVMIFFITVPVYIASVILPTWRVAAMEIDEVLR